jgi:hypothetical protein
MKKNTEGQKNWLSWNLQPHAAGAQARLNMTNIKLVMFRGRLDEKEKITYQKRWLSWNLQPRTDEGASQRKPDPKSGTFGKALCISSETPEAKLESTASPREGSKPEGGSSSSKADPLHADRKSDGFF